MVDNNIQVVIMCKAPMAGRVKTRLMRDFSAIEAAKLHAAMATTVIQRAKRLFESVVVAADDPTHPFFAGFGVEVTTQGEGDLGDRMQRQVKRAFDDGVDAVVLLGTDSPHMQDQRLLDATSQLQDYDIVLGPVEDGGYDLLAMSAAYPLFDGIPWSTTQVLDRTVQMAKELHCSIGLLEVSFDIDVTSDLERAEALGWHRVS